MTIKRRDFLKQGLFAVGGAVSGATGAKALGSSCSSSEHAPHEAKVSLPVLTADGRLVRAQVEEGEPVGAPPDDPRVREGVPGRKWVMVIDLANCDGCGSCTDACNKMHFIPSGQDWLRVLKMQDSPDAAPYWFPKPCFHCDNPPCTKVCPVGATFKRQDGVVLVDNEQCIGCRFCMAACPYGARVFNWEHPEEPPEAQKQPYSPERGFPRRVGTTEKCDFCPEMAAAGRLPACVTGCPHGAIYYGDQNEDAVTNSNGETVRFSQLLEERAGYRHLEKLGTKPRVYYLPPRDRRFSPPGGASDAQSATGLFTPETSTGSASS